ncbi:MAG: T9SS type A sorting domain-containing protein, partial [Candidatus Kapaibacterium sp.]
VPVYLDTNLSISYRNKTYWLRDLSFRIGASWNKYMLKYLDNASVFGSRCTVTQQRFDSLTIAFDHVDSVRAGKLADLRFLILVPDTAEDDLRIVPDTAFATDSLLFINLIPQGSTTQIQTGAKCNTTTSRSMVAIPVLYSTQPNPAHDRVTMRFDIQESVPVSLFIVNTTGEIVRTVLDGKQKFASGQHSVDVDVSSLPPGVYSTVISAGIFGDTKRMVIVR